MRSDFMYLTVIETAQQLFLRQSIAFETWYINNTASHK